MPLAHLDLTDFTAVSAGLHRGDFTALAPLFAVPPTDPASQLSAWVEQGRFAEDPSALNEALACACFNGRTAWASYLVTHGANLADSAGTGLNALHWAANRGQLETVLWLLGEHPDLEARNAYGGTVLSGTVWATLHEPKPAHRAIVAALLAAGAASSEVAYPSGDPEIDALLRPRRGAPA